MLFNLKDKEKMKKVINLVAIISIPSSLTINVTSILEYKEFVNFSFTVVISIIAVISGYFALRNLAIKKKIAQIELQQKIMELQDKKEDREKKEKEPAGTGFFKNNVIK
jgi:hypothetical protein